MEEEIATLQNNEEDAMEDVESDDSSTQPLSKRRRKTIPSPNPNENPASSRLKTKRKRASDSFDPQKKANVNSSPE